MKTLIICGKLITLNFIKDISIEEDLDRSGNKNYKLNIQVRYIDNEKVSLIKIRYNKNYYHSLIYLGYDEIENIIKQNLDIEEIKTEYQKYEEEFSVVTNCPAQFIRCERLYTLVNRIAALKNIKFEDYNYAKDKADKIILVIQNAMLDIPDPIVIK